MTNNDILRSLRYTFGFDDAKMISIFALADCPVTRSQVCDWLKAEADPGHKNCGDRHLAIFLNGLIRERRGKREGPQAEPEKRINNNIVFRKLKIALNLQAIEILEILALADVHISKHELSAFFRRPDHKHYRECKDQVLRNFLKGLAIRSRKPETEITPT